MDPVVFNLTLFCAIDLAVLAGLVLGYRKLGHRFLRPASATVVVVLTGRVLADTGLVGAATVSGMGVSAGLHLIYCLLLLATVCDIVQRRFPRRAAMAIGGLFAMGYTGLAVTDDVGRLPAFMIQLPAAIVLGVGCVLLLRFRRSSSIAAPVLAGLMLVMLCLPGAMVVFDAWALFRLTNDSIALLIGVILLMLTLEQAALDLESRDQRLESQVEERRRLELQFSQAQKLESLGVLAGGIAHDFNNMLTSILGYASLATKKLPVDSEIRQDLYMVMSGARQAVDLTSQMLIYAGKGALAFESVDLSRVVEDMSSLIHSIVPRKIQLVQKLARDLPTLRGDKVQVGQVAMNLVANAVDAIQDNTGVIEVSSGIAEVDEDLIRSCFFAENREPDAYLYLRVKDTGVGMSDHQVERIFDPFYTEKRTSRGLGLSSLSGIVRQHKGFIRVVSEPDSGSEFTIYFPVVVIQESSGDSRFAARSSDRKGKVLLADDDPRIRTLMASILESDHFRLTSAEDGKEALRIYEQEPDQFDLLVLDCTMPKMSGTELYRKIRGNGSMVPIVLVSGYHQEQVAASINHDPNAYFIKKPFNVDDFLAMVHDALKDRQRHPV